MIYPLAIKTSEKCLYSVIQEIGETELQEDETELTGGSKQSFYNNIDTDNIEIR